MNLTYTDRLLVAAVLLWLVGVSALGVYFVSDSAAMLALSLASTTVCALTTAEVFR